MKRISIETPAIAIICYCILAISVTTVVAQEKSKATTEKTDTSTEKTDTSTEKTKASTGNQLEEPKKSEGKKTGSEKSESNQSDVTDSKLLTSHSIGDSAFKVATPDWFKDTETSAVKVEAFGYTQSQVESDLRSEIRKSAHQVIDELLGDEAHQYVHFSDQELRELVSKEEIIDGVYRGDAGEQPCEFYFAHMDLGSSFKNEAKKRWIETKQESRLLQYGLITGATLLLIGFIFGGIKLNSATSGFYQGRLQFFVVVVILGVIAAGVYFGTKIDWI